MSMSVSVRALVILSAVVASAVARPGSLAPAADPASSKVPTARTGSNQEAGAGDKSLAQVAKSLQNPAPDSLETSRPDDPTLSRRISDGSDSDDATGIRFVDNPHIGLPFGAVLPGPDPVAPARDTPITSTADPLDTIRRDSPHVGLPPMIPTLDSTASTDSASSPTSVYQTGTYPDDASGNSNIHTEVPSKGNDASNLSINTSPDSVNVNRDPVLPKTHFANCASPGFFKVPIHGTHVFVPASSPMPHFTSNAGLHGRSGAASLPTINGNSYTLSSKPFGGFLTKTVNTKFTNTPSSIFTPRSSPNNFFRSFPVNSPTSNPPSHIPVNTAPYGFPNRSPNTYPLTNIAFITKEPAYLYLFSKNVPHGNVVNTAQGPVVFGGPVNLALFPKQPSLDDINQVLVAYAAAPTLPAAGGPAFNPPADTAA